MTILEGNIVDLVNKEIYSGEIHIKDGIIENIVRNNKVYNNYFLPGYVDAHIHIESSMLVPSEFAKIAVKHGTIGTVSDPHEIANVMGIEGVNFMIENGKKVPFYFNFGAPSCVPATTFETAGATIDSNGIEELMKRDDILYLAEMMNYPGVIYSDKEVLKKIQIAQKYNKPTDGHAPGLRGEQMKAYFAAGISTDHECFTYEEALEKAKQGVKILIREGSAAKNFDALIPLLKLYPDQIMFCSDDLHPDSLLEGHINLLVKRALALGYDVFDVLRASSYNAIKHYKLDIGLLQVGDKADFIEVDKIVKPFVLSTYVKGLNIYHVSDTKSRIKTVEVAIINNFNISKKVKEDFEYKTKTENIRVIEAIEGQLVTNEIIAKINPKNESFESDIDKDILKIAVINRYQNTKVAIGFIKNFGLKEGAIASCIAHDSHNIITVGTTDEDICNAVNLIIENKGGISLANKNTKEALPLPIAGILTNADAFETAEKYIDIDKKAKAFGTKLKAPFMTLSFMALLVIPKLKLSDKGLFDGENFKFCNVEA
jgi:adenine deaminase